MDFETIQPIHILRTQNPIIHCITNAVTLNDCANALIALGASPTMADAPQESAEITSHAQALVLNMGQLNPDKCKAMLQSGKQANKMGIPVILDPVGVGLSSFRKQGVLELLEQVKISILRCNYGEAASIQGLAFPKNGIDSHISISLPDGQALAQNLAKQYQCTIAMTGQVDIIATQNHLYQLTCGHPMLSRVTGMGCVASALCGAFASVLDNAAQGALCGLLSIGIAGQLAAKECCGTGRFHIQVMDILSTLSDSILQNYLHLTEVS